MQLTAEQQADIASARAEVAETRRVTVPELEEILLQPIPVLDHGDRKSVV